MTTCRNGHSDGRYANGKCRGCHRDAMARYAAKDPEKYQDILARAKASFRARNPGREYAQFRESLSDPVKREAYRARYNEWHRQAHRKDPAKKYALNAERRGKRGRATPAWLTAEQRSQMREIYRTAKSMGPGWHVDHIVPLNGAVVSGLHVPWNLRIVRAEENLRKGNKVPAAA